MQFGSARSLNIEDRRGRGIGPGAKLGAGGFVLVMLAAVIGGPEAAQMVAALVGMSQQSASDSVTPGPLPAGSDEQADFVSAVLADTEQTWNAIFAQQGARYQEPVLVLFDGAVSSQCGMQSAAVGPFYCPLDQRVFLDLAFFRDLDARFGAPGDFARAYVVGHEVGHHVQNLMGISDRVHQARARSSEREGNELSVRLELQADCLAGVWANHANAQRRILEPGDVEEGLRAAAAIGDDRLQQQTRGRVVPDGFTHGSSEQRVRWFKRGLQQGNADACDTFNTTSL